MKSSYTQKRKTFVYFCTIILFSFNGFAQVGIGNTDPAASSLLDIRDSANNKGILIPRISIPNLTSAAPVTSPANSLLVYNTNATTGPGFFYWSGSRWVGIDGGNDWSLTGNSGTTPGTGTNQNYLGTRDDQAMIIATNNTQRLRVLGNGQVVINQPGTPGSSDRFSVVGNPNERAIVGNSYGSSGKGVFGYAHGDGMGVHGQTPGSGYGIFAASTGTAPGLAALTLGNGRALWVQNSGTGDGMYLTVEDGNGMYNNIKNGSGIYNKILATNKAGVINDLMEAGGIGEAIFFNDKSGVGINVDANPVGTGGDVWAFSAKVKTNSTVNGETSYGGILGGEQNGRSHSILMNHRGTAGRNVEFNTHGINNPDPNIQAISLNRQPTIKAQNQNSSRGSVIKVADISYIGTATVDHIAISGYSSPASNWGIGIVGTGGYIGVRGVANYAPTGYALYGVGDTGASGTKYFAIDDPRDPANKILKHASIESNEILNLYRGIETFGADGTAVVRMPDYYEAININASYQLTPIGAAMPNLYIEKEVTNGAFIIAGGVPGKKVSWILTAERNDPYLQQNPEKRNMEEDKGTRRGQYFMPELYGQPKEKAIGYIVPEKAEMSSISKDAKVDYIENDKINLAETEKAKAIVEAAEASAIVASEEDVQNAKDEQMKVKKIPRLDAKD